MSLEAKAKWPYSRLILRRKQCFQGNSFPFDILELRSRHPQTPFAKYSLQRLLATLVREMEWTEDTQPQWVKHQTNRSHCCLCDRMKEKLKRMRQMGWWACSHAVPENYRRRRFSEQLSSHICGMGRHLTEGVKLGKILPIRVELKSSWFQTFIPVGRET